MKEKPKLKKAPKRASRKEVPKKVRKPDGHVIPNLKPEVVKEPVYTVRTVLGYVIAARAKVNFCLVSIKGKGDPVPCTIPAFRIDATKLKGRVIEMEEYTRDGKQYYRHISLANTGAWHGYNPTKE